ncbi:MAG: CoA transferase [Haloarculaceae archaeon]
MDDLGLDDGNLVEHNPGRIYCSLSGYGKWGPRRTGPPTTA